MTFGTPTWVDQLQELLQARLAQAVGIPSDRVLESLADDQDHLQFPPHDQFLTLRPTSFPVSSPGVTGAGRLLTGFDATWRVALFHRYSTDQELRDNRKLRSATRGVLNLVLRTISALQMFVPTPPDEPTKALVREPIRLRSFDIQTRPVRSGSPWTCTPTFWQVQFNTEFPR